MSPWSSSSDTDSPWLSALISNIQDAIIVLDASGQTVYESPSARAILGDRPNEVLTAFGLERIHPDERETVVRSFERAIAVPGSVARATYRFRRADDSWRHLEAVAKNLLDDPELQGVVITFRDVTERIEALEASERVGVAQEEFLSRMSHELRTPLHAILGWTQLLQARGQDDLREALDQISGAGHHLLSLVEEALDLAAVKEGKITLVARQVDVRTLVLEALDLVRPLAMERRIVLEVCHSDADTVIEADPNRLRQVLLNLLSNGVKYNNEGGSVFVGFQKTEVNNLRIAVRDTGRGLPEECVNDVFERFERLRMDSSEIEGSGLGLAITRRLVEMMGGTIGVESRLGVGAEFWIVLPRKSEIGRG